MAQMQTASQAPGDDRGEPVVAFESVSLQYDDGPEVLRDLGLSLMPGSFHFLTGPSGAGKSSLLRLMYLALRPTRGALRLFGRDTATAPRRELPSIRRRMGVVFQDFRLLDHLSALDNVALPLIVAGARREAVRADVTELLDWVGLGDHLESKPPTLSGGQKQRVAIARAVVGSPSLLVADEPTGSVDDQSAARLMRLFEELNKMGTTVLIATHNRTLVDSAGYPELRLEGGTITHLPGTAA